MMDDEEADLREQIFHNNVREQIVSIEQRLLLCSRVNFDVDVRLQCLLVHSLQIFQIQNLHSFTSY